MIFNHIQYFVQLCYPMTFLHICENIDFLIEIVYKGVMIFVIGALWFWITEMYEQNLQQLQTINSDGTTCHIVTI